MCREACRMIFPYTLVNGYLLIFRRLDKSYPIEHASVCTFAGESVFFHQLAQIGYDPCRELQLQGFRAGVQQFRNFDEGQLFPLAVRRGGLEHAGILFGGLL